jgi:inner membrane protein
MNGKTHLLTGLAAGFLLSQSVKPADAGMVIAVTSVAALLPDIDHPQSLISSFIPGGFILSAFTGNHRGVTHSALAGFVAGGLAFLVSDNPMIGLGVGVGWLIHLVGDMLTPSGVPLLLPFRWRLRLLPRPVLGIISPLIEAATAAGALAVSALLLREILLS